jgi:hypothetical protein
MSTLDAGILGLNILLGKEFIWRQQYFDKQHPHTLSTNVSIDTTTQP